MTTEVLRNMIYAGSSSLDRLGVVVLDEVHYLADRFRGSVWEEVIVHVGTGHRDRRRCRRRCRTPRSSAPGSREVRGDTTRDRERAPARAAVAARACCARASSTCTRPASIPRDPGPNPRLNPELEAVASDRATTTTDVGPRDRYRAREGQRSPSRGAARRASPSSTNSTRQALLARDRLRLLARGLRGRRRPGAGVRDAAHVGRRARRDSRDRRGPLRGAAPRGPWGRWASRAWRDHLEAGIAAHHAGMIPLFKEVVEELFAAGLIKVVYATETLALGINMPARSVVLEKLVKWDGQGSQGPHGGGVHAADGPGGAARHRRRGPRGRHRAPRIRRGSAGAPGFAAHLPADVVVPARRTTWPSTWSARSGVQRAREVLEMSFAQFQADQSVVGKARRVRELDGALEGFREAMQCDRGDFSEYAGLREKLSRNEKDASQAARKATARRRSHN